MKNRRRAFWQTVGAALLTLLGFGSCCGGRMLRKPPTVQPVVYGPPPVLIDTIRIEPPKPEPTPVVYGPPVVNYEEKKAAE